ncbi:type-1 angiotensin II receptor A-like [Asterias rubens]|uniref:type-1 angiotensin II receptor A-like n=1 Tax=Asterias rubens TaxID=7604 RepID=UPI001454F802|nr:type-1 angiotensin II receptor A-like [Asterias rubens]
MDERCVDGYFNYTADEKAALVELYTKFDDVVITVLMPIILLIGLLGNASFILMLYRVPKMRTVTNFYLANLAVSDSMFLAFGIISKIHEYWESSVSFHPAYHGLFSCFASNSVVSLSYFATLFILTLVSLEKYYGICRPIRHRLVSGWNRTVKLTVCAWLLSLLVAATGVPSYCTLNYYCFMWPPGDLYVHLYDVYAYCGPVAYWADAYANTIQTIPFFTAFVLSATMYSLIVRRLSQRVDHPHGQQSDNNHQFSDRAVKIRNQVARMLVVNGTLFFLLLSPFEIFSLLLSYNHLLREDRKFINYSQKQTGLQICRVLSYVNSAINPYVYGMVNSRYRHAFKVTFFLTRNNRVDAEPSRSRQNHLSTLHDVHLHQATENPN